MRLVNRGAESGTEALWRCGTNGMQGKKRKEIIQIDGEMAKCYVQVMESLV